MSDSTFDALKAENESLRAALRDIRDHTGDSKYPATLRQASVYAYECASEALGGKKAARRHAPLVRWTDDP